MKHLRIAVCFAALLLAAVGCASPAQPPVIGKPDSEQTYESYLAQTVFRFPKSWSYERDDEAGEGLTAWFEFRGGRCVVQFLWMDQTQLSHNVFLQQLDMDEVREREMQAGAYQGRYVAGRDGSAYTEAFEGVRSWYDTELMLVMRAVAQYEDENTYDRQAESFSALLKSVSVTEDDQIPVLKAEDAAELPFTDFGLTMRAPSTWAYYPEYDLENGHIAVDFEVAAGECYVTVERTSIDDASYGAMLESVRALGENEDVYCFSYRQDKHGAAEMTCVQNGKIIRLFLSKQTSTDGTQYCLWRCSQLRPLIDRAYYESAVLPLWDSIEIE